MAKGSDDFREPLADTNRPKKVRKRVAEIPHLNDDEVYAEVLREHFADESTGENNPTKKRRSRRTRKTKAKRKWWWPKKAVPPDEEREKMIQEIEAIYAANGFIRRDSMPHEFHETHAIRHHLERLKAGLIPEITKRGVLNVD